MDNHLTEISNSYLFSEYLSCLGVAMPKFKENWELKRGNHVLARVRMSAEGQARFYIAASQLCHRANR